jgi:hypothetical protein
MKRNLLAIFSFGALSLLLTAAGAYAQPGVEAQVPFAFNVGKTHLPAGTYTIKADRLYSSITIRNRNNSSTVFAHAQPEYPGGKDHTLVFRHVGDQYFLAEIWGEQGSEGLKIRAPKPSTRVEEATQRWPTGDEVLIALK